MGPVPLTMVMREKGAMMMLLMMMMIKCLGEAAGHAKGICRRRRARSGAAVPIDFGVEAACEKSSERRQGGEVGVLR